MYLVLDGSIRAAFASRPSRIWSVPPAEPPAKEDLRRVGLHLLDQVLEVADR
jgi:hypothetical protein